MGEFDIILGMDWLSRYKATISCVDKTVHLKTPSGEDMTVFGDRKSFSLLICTYARTRRHISRGCKAFLAHVIDSAKDSKSLSDIPIVNEFSDHFHDEFPGLPPDRQVEFRIDLVSGATTIAKAPYRFAPTEMQEMMNKLQELIDKGFIRLSSSPRGAPVWFVKK